MASVPRRRAEAGRRHRCLLASQIKIEMAEDRCRLFGGFVAVALGLTGERKSNASVVVRPPAVKQSAPSMPENSPNSRKSGSWVGGTMRVRCRKGSFSRSDSQCRLGTNGAWQLRSNIVVSLFKVPRSRADLASWLLGNAPSGRDQQRRRGVVLRRRVATGPATGRAAHARRQAARRLFAFGLAITRGIPGVAGRLPGTVNSVGFRRSLPEGPSPIAGRPGQVECGTIAECRRTKKPLAPCPARTPRWRSTPDERSLPNGREIGQAQKESRQVGQEPDGPATEPKLDHWARV